MTCMVAERGAVSKNVVIKERAIPFAYSVRTVLGSSHSSSVIWRLFNVLTPSLYSVRCLTVLVLLSFVLKLTTPIGFD